MPHKDLVKRRECSRACNKRWRATHAAHVKLYNSQRSPLMVEATRKRRALKPDVTKMNDHKAYLKKEYGLTTEAHESLRRRGCWLCLATLEAGFVVDHDHVTNVVRGGAHASCNKIIGFAKESPKLLRQIADSLEKYQNMNWLSDEPCLVDPYHVTYQEGEVEAPEDIQSRHKIRRRYVETIAHKSSGSQVDASAGRRKQRRF